MWCYVGSDSTELRPKSSMANNWLRVSKHASNSSRPGTSSRTVAGFTRATLARSKLQSRQRLVFGVDRRSILPITGTRSGQKPNCGRRTDARSRDACHRKARSISFPGHRVTGASASMKSAASAGFVQSGTHWPPDGSRTLPANAIWQHS